MLNIPKFDPVERALGAPLESYLDNALIDTIPNAIGWVALAKVLFYSPWRGAELPTSYRLRFKTWIDADAAAEAIHIWLTPWEPNDLMFNTVGYALSQWCEPVH